MKSEENASLRKSDRIPNLYLFWIDRILLLGMGLIVSITAEPVLAIGREHFVALLEPWHPIVGWLASVAASAAVWHMATKHGGFYLRQLRYYRTAPPVWALALLGCVVYVFAVLHLRVEGYPLILSPRNIILQMSVILSGPTLTCAYRWIMSRDTSPSPILDPGKDVRPHGPSGEVLNVDDAQYWSWVEREEPIRDEANDNFGAATAARRIARLLLQNPPKSVGLVGPYGSGKSSICFLVEKRLTMLESTKAGNGNQQSTQTRPPIICRVDGWGLHQESAAMYILKTMVLCLSREVECSSLAGLPTEYSATLREIPSGMGRIVSGWLSHQVEPTEILRRFDELLARSGLRMVVILEDLDRSVNQHILCDEVYPLLDRMTRLNRMCFLFAVSDDGHGLEGLLRVADHLEVLTRVSRTDARRTIEQFWRWLKAQRPDDVDPIEPRIRDTRLAPYGDMNEGPISSIAELASNPRRIKSSLRRALTTWEQLHGEIDCEDLLVCNILRSCCPTSYALLQKNIGELRHRSRGGHQFDDDTQKAWDTRFSSIAPEERAHVEVLFDVLFPNWRGSRFGTEFRSPQGIVVSDPVDYWVRLNAEELSPHEIPDQEVLHHLHGWITAAAGTEYRDLTRHFVEDDNFAHKVIQFAPHCLDAMNCRRFTNCVLTFILQERQSCGMRGDLVYGSVELLARFYSELGQREPDDVYFHWVAEELAKVLPYSLRFAMGILSTWGVKVISTNRGLQERVWRQFVSMLRELIGQDPEHLIESLRDGNGRELLDLVFDQSFGAYWHESPGAWSWLSDALLSSGAEAPEISQPQLARLLYNRVNQSLHIGAEGGSRSRTYIRDEELMDCLFSARRREVLSLLSTEVDMSKSDEEMRDILTKARHEATMELKKKYKKAPKRSGKAKRPTSKIRS
ncbi:MAG: hypothetical protein IT365_15315 [Candidatus Hydrogenedentes bacterium]|nr:hypothetical protein [Candidatus Hydrogenedentota bacterium]